MSSKLIIPFNYQPFSVSVKTGAYTIPAGYYAYVTASVQGADTFSIGGVVALQGVTAVATSGTGFDTANVNLTSGATTTALSYTVLAGYKFQIHASELNGNSLNNSTLTAHSGEVVLRTLAGPATIHQAWVDGVSTLEFAEGNVLTMNHVNTSFNATKELWGKIERTTTINAGQSAGVTTGSFWVSTGTALTTSGGSYTVTLYPNIS